MLRRSNAVDNLKELAREAPKQDADLSREEHIQFQRTKHAFFKKHQLGTSKAIAIPQPAPAKKTPDDDLRGVSVFKYSQNEHQMLEQAKREKCLAEAVFGFQRKC